MSRILVSGAGIAGTVHAYWAARAGFKVTVLEKAPSLRDAGQNIDIDGTARDIVKKMGLYETIHSAGTGEEGLYVVDERDRNWGANPLDKSGRGIPSCTSEVEIVRGTLAKIFYEATKRDAEYVFGDSITALDEQADGVHVSFARAPPRTFDLVVAADGIFSKTRSLAFPEIGHTCVKSLHQIQAYFTIRKPYRDLWARIYHAPGGRYIFLRPNKAGIVHAIVSVTPKDDVFANYHEMSVPQQKRAMQALFNGVGWEGPQVIEAMMASDDFYLGQIAQVKLPRWSRGRTVVIGDAAYCPSPYTGMGTSMAIVGAYVLAGEMMRAKDGSSGRFDAARAVEGYEKVMRPWVDKVQRLPPGVPALTSPESSWGITVFRLAAAFITRSGILRLAAWFGKDSPEDEGLEMPAYEFPEQDEKRE